MKMPMVKLLWTILLTTTSDALTYRPGEEIINKSDMLRILTAILDIEVSWMLADDIS